MTGLVPYLLFPGTARGALARYAEIFGGELALHSYASSVGMTGQRMRSRTAS